MLAQAFIWVTAIIIFYVSSVISIIAFQACLDALYYIAFICFNLVFKAQFQAFLRQSTCRHFGSRLHRFCRFFSKHKLISGIESLKSGSLVPVCFPRVWTRPFPVLECKMQLSRDCSNVYPTHLSWTSQRNFLWIFVWLDKI